MNLVSVSGNNKFQIHGYILCKGIGKDIVDIQYVDVCIGRYVYVDVRKE